MKFPQNILVIVSGKRRHHVALGRALKFAELYDVKLTLFSCVYDPGTEMSPLLSAEAKAKIRQAKIDERLDYLDKLKDFVEAKGIPVETKVMWHRKIQNAVSELCEQLNPDLVVKRISESASSINPFIMPMDWQLLRKCPVPLLLVRDEEWKTDAPVLAAVDASAENKAEKDLNRQIVAYAKMFAKIIDTETHVITTHINPTVDNALDIPDFNLEDLKRQVDELNRKNLRGLTNEFKIPETHLHVEEGLAEVKIPEKADELGTQLVVMGTVARSGLKGAFMGNTAERVLTHLQYEVLALKPKQRQ